MIREAPVELRMPCRVEGLRSIADGVREITLIRIGGAPWPAWRPGAHIDLQLPNQIVRQYSLCGDPDDSSRLRIAVLREPEGRGGSSYIHDTLHVGDELSVLAMRNNFALAPAGRYLFIAGGIGITPILSMIREVAREGADWQLLYGGRSRNSMAYLDELAEPYGDRVTIRPQDEYGYLDLEGVLRAQPDSGYEIYACGPPPLLDALSELCPPGGEGILHLERFVAEADVTVSGAPFEIELARSGEVLLVPGDASILDVVRDHGLSVPSSCEEGVCGSCETAVLGGTVDHRDSILSDEERAANDTMMICVSRSADGRLVLDL